MVELTENEREILLVGGDLMTRLLGSGDFLPAAFAGVDGAGLRAYQLYADGMERFSPASLILPPGQATPILEEPFWRIFGVFRGAIARRRFELDANGRPLPQGEKHLAAGGVDCLRAGGFSQLVNLDADNPAIVLCVYGGDIGKAPRRSFAEDGTETVVTLGYANGEDAPPYDIWTIQTRIED
jgi:predicted metal-dependent enzyme (double-stranded beta helix superfamily)